MRWNRFGFIGIVVALLLLASSPVYAVSDQTGALIDDRAAELREHIVKLVGEGLKIQSISNPEYPEEMTGGKQWPTPIQKMLEYALVVGEAMGMRAVNMDGKTGWLEIGPKDAPEMVMVLGHLDTVGPSNVASWAKDPFSGEIADGKIYGRGATDDKGPTMSAIYSMKIVQDLGIPLKYRVRLLFGTDEERPYWYGVNYYKDNGGELPLWGFTPDAGIALQEKGITNGWPRVFYNDSASDTYMESFKTPGNVYNSVADNTVVRIRAVKGKTADELATALKAEIAKTPILASTDVTVDGGNTLVIKNTGFPGHGASPHGINAITRTLVALTKVDTTAGWKNAAVTFLKVFPENEAVDAVSKPSAEVDGKTLGIDRYRETHFGEESPVTLNVGFSEWTSADAFMTINVRYPHPTGGVTAEQRQKEIHDAIDKGFRDAGIDNPNVESASLASLFAEDDYLVTAMKRVGLQLDGKEPNVSKNRGGATYIKAFPGRMMSFGSTSGGGGHGYNEYCTQDSVERVAKLIARGIVELAGTDVANAVPAATISSDVPLYTDSASLKALVTDKLKLDAEKCEVVTARTLSVKKVDGKFDIALPENCRAFMRAVDGTYKEVPVTGTTLTISDRTPDNGDSDAPWDSDVAAGAVKITWIALREKK